MAIIQAQRQILYLKSATVVRAPGDNSCLYHSLSYNLNREELYDNAHEINNGFTLQHLVNDYIRENLSVVIWTSLEVCESFAEAIVGEGYNTSDYYARMSLNSSWGGMIEICAVAEMFHVNIEIFESTADPNRRFQWIGTFKYSLNDTRTKSLYILYTGNNHYDSLIDIVDDSLIDDISVGADMNRTQMLPYIGQTIKKVDRKKLGNAAKIRFKECRCQKYDYLLRMQSDFREKFNDETGSSIYRCARISVAKIQ